MRAIDWQQFLQQQRDRHGKVVFTPTELANASSQDWPSLKAALRRLVDRGVMLTGGGALLGELDLALREQTGLAISVADEPLNCVAMGTGKALEYEKQLRHVIDYDS